MLKNLLKLFASDKKFMFRGIATLSFIVFLILSAIFSFISFGFFFENDYFADSPVVILYYIFFALAILSCGFVAFSYRDVKIGENDKGFSSLRGFGFVFGAISVIFIKLIPLHEDLQNCIKNGLSVADTKKEYASFVFLVVLYVLAFACDVVHSILTKKKANGNVLCALHILPMLIYPITFLFLYRNMDVPVNSPRRLFLSLALLVMMMDAFYAEWIKYKKANVFYVFFRLCVLVFCFGMAFETDVIPSSEDNDIFEMVAFMVICAGLYGLIDFVVSVVNGNKKEEKADECQCENSVDA